MTLVGKTLLWHLKNTTLSEYCFKYYQNFMKFCGTIHIPEYVRVLKSFGML